MTTMTINTAEELLCLELDWKLFNTPKPSSPKELDICIEEIMEMFEKHNQCKIYDEAIYYFKSIALVDYILS